MASTKSGLDDHYAPGQYIGRVGSQKVLAERFLGRGETDQALSERHEIYLVTTRIRGVSGRVRRILSRFVAPKESLIAGLRKEEETLKRVGTHPNIDSTFTLLERTRPDGALEILVLKDFYPEGSVWGMLKDSPDHLAEVDILHIFADVCQGVLEMHTLRPPLIHRNIRPANIARRKTSYKLTGLAAAAPVTRVLPSDPQELRALQDDMDKHMSLDYRAPETLDLSQRHPIDEKTDVWALGVLLFELCWSRTPFMHDSSAILSAEYTIPTRQAYSPDLISLLGVCPLGTSASSSPS
ncbi:kinase-like domain-containing protein [Gloeopeniophorella convolvens]|nr:kinase-like domain-containing protein [Gloeopeniophorella convolvens]